MARAAWAWAWAWLAAWAWAGAGGSLLPLDAERLRAGVGGYAVLNCHLDFPFGTEIPYHLQWDKDGESVLSWYSAGGEPEALADRWGGRVRRLGDARAGLGRASINVSAVRETDAGLYRCRVTFPNRSPPARDNGTFYYLEVDGGNLIATPPTNVTVLEGARAELECLPKSRESAVRWLRDGEPLAPELRARAELPPNGSLVIRRAASADPGEYACRVRDPAGAEQSAAAFLDVQYAAKVVYAPKERYLPLGKPASLDCHFSANPPLTNLRWEKDGFLFDPYNVPGVFYSRNGSLLFNRVDESHEGRYSCTPYNALGTAGASPRVRVRVLRPPALARRPLPLYVARLGATLTLPCALQPSEADGDAAPALQWTREDGAPLPRGRHSVDAGSLTLAHVAPEDGGAYWCSATNAAARVAARVELRVENVPPHAPRGLRAEPAATAVRLQWRAGEGAPDAEYIVWYRLRAASEWRTMRLLTRGVTRATLRGLRPAADYELRVLAQDAIGDGLFSKPVFVRTLDLEASTAPDDAEPTSRASADSEDPTATTEGADEVTPAAGGEAAPAAAPDELQVRVRLLDEGALVRWSRARGDAERCTVRWYEGDRLLQVTHTFQDHLLVGAVTEGAEHAARVECARGAGAARLGVPRYGRLRAAALGCAGAALLLAALAAALYAARRRLRPRAADKRAR